MVPGRFFLFEERVVIHVQHANISRMVLVAVAATLLSTPAPGESQGTSRPRPEAPADIRPLYGNTVELKIGREIGQTRQPAIQSRYYFTADGKQVLTAWQRPESDADGSYRGVTYGREDKTCIENSPTGNGEQSIICGTLMVRQNIVTLIQERRRWNTAFQFVHSDRIETVFSFNGQGQCSFIWEERRVIGTTSYAAVPGESNTGTCRVVAGRHLDVPRTLTRE